MLFAFTAGRFVRVAGKPRPIGLIPCSRSWELQHKTIGIVGFGNIGQKVARIAAALGMQVIYYNHREKKADMGQQVPLETLFQHSDVVTLHCPLTPENRHMVNSSLLHQMKTNSFFDQHSKRALW
jgi:phosphoglycerate dehydrogenase-like enzyme